MGLLRIATFAAIGIALVVGNGAYAKSPLATAANDAGLIAHLADNAYVPDHILVQFKPDITPQALAGTSIVGSLSLVPGLYDIQLEPGLTVAQALDAYDSESEVISAQPDYLVQVHVKVSGILNKMHVKEGELVKKGKTLAEIDALFERFHAGFSRERPPRSKPNSSPVGDRCTRVSSVKALMIQYTRTPSRAASSSSSNALIGWAGRKPGTPMAQAKV